MCLPESERAEEKTFWKEKIENAFWDGTLHWSYLFAISKVITANGVDSAMLARAQKLRLVL